MTSTCSKVRCAKQTCVLLAALTILPHADSFSVPRLSDSLAARAGRNDGLCRNRFRRWKARDSFMPRMSSFTEDISTTTIESEMTGIGSVSEMDASQLEIDNITPPNSIAVGGSGIMGKFDDERLVFPELGSGEVPRMFSSLKYEKSGGKVVSALHASGSVLGAAALVAGTTVGAGVLALPTATAPAGFLPSAAAMAIAWWYMTMSGLLIAELSINRMGETGRPGAGLLDLIESSLGKLWGTVGSAAYFFLHYAVMVAYIAQGGANLDGVLDALGVEALASFPGIGQLLFAGTCGMALYAAKPSVIEKANNVLVAGVAATFIGIMAIGASSADFAALIDPANQHPEQVANAFPILFLSMVYQNIVPTVVTQLEGDRAKITTSIVAGTTAPFLMFLAWNGVILGNVMATAGSSMENVNPVALLQSGVHDGAAMLGPLVGVFSELALITSFVGFVYGLLDALTDVANLPSAGPKFEAWKPALFAGILLPPLTLSVGNPEIFYDALDYGGAFGVSTLFLVLPPIMVWKERYGDENKPMTARPMVPFGKIPLAGMWKAAGALIVEQGAEKLGIIDFFRHMHN